MSLISKEKGALCQIDSSIRRFSVTSVLFRFPQEWYKNQPALIRLWFSKKAVAEHVSLKLKLTVAH